MIHVLHPSVHHSRGLLGLVDLLLRLLLFHQHSFDKLSRSGTHDFGLGLGQFLLGLLELLLLLPLDVLALLGLLSLTVRSGWHTFGVREAQVKRAEVDTKDVWSLLR